MSKVRFDLRKVATMLCLAATAVMLSSCGDDEKPANKEPKIEQPGFTPGDVQPEELPEEVRKIIPDDILDAFNKMGMKINVGINPPNVEGSYFISPSILIRSNFPDAPPGTRALDALFTLSQQDNAKLTVVVNYNQGNGHQIGEGLGSFITGDGNKFSVYTEISGESRGNPFKSVEVYSGEITPDGIKDFHLAGIVTMEAPGTIKKGQGRLFYDSDGLSERVNPDDFDFKKDSMFLLKNGMSCDMSCGISHGMSLLEAYSKE